MSNYAVIRSVRTHQGDAMIPVLVVTDVPEGDMTSQVKEAIDKAGFTIGDSGIPWGNHYVAPEPVWKDLWQDIEWRQTKKLSLVQLLDMANRANSEKRITLRTEPRLHAALVEEARVRNVSLNELLLTALREWLQTVRR